MFLFSGPHNLHSHSGLGLLPLLPSLQVNSNHNHTCNSLQASSLNSIPDSIVDEINKLYECGETPSTARNIFVKKLKLSCTDDLDFHEKYANRKHCPRQRDFRYIYEKYTRNKLGGLDVEMYRKLEEDLLVYQEQNKDARIKYQPYGGENQPFVIAMVTLLMKRVHQNVQQSADLVFVDSTSNCEGHNLKIFLLVTHSISGVFHLASLFAKMNRRRP